MKIAIVGATGMVGRVMIEILERSDIKVSELVPVASERSKGNSVYFRGKSYKIITIQEALLKKPMIALFSAGGDLSLEWAEKFTDMGTTVIDNSSVWRMDPSKKLIVPEINSGLLTEKDKIIANPNCSTIQMVLVLNPLHKKYNIKRVVVSTYQSITGTGKKAVDQLQNEINGNNELRVYPHKIFKNVIPQCDVFLDNGYTKEEMKIINETQKILDKNIQVTATAVRVPVEGGHSENINIEFEKEYDIEEIKNILSKEKGVELYDDISKNKYPMPIISHNRDEVFVGRLRRDNTHPRAINMWIVADNLRKGAALNAVQIAEYICNNNLI